MSLNPITDLITTAVTPIVARLADLIPDPAARAAAQQAALTELTNTLANADAAQDATNTAEAGSHEVFIAGWRPFIGWCCGLGFLTQFMLGPIFSWVSALTGSHAAFPTLDMSTMMPVLLGMLGLGGMRTIEKLNGVSGLGVTKLGKSG